MALTSVFTGIPVSDHERALDWYQRFAGRPPDLIPNDIEACWQLAEAAWIYFVVDTDRAGSAYNTLLVDDLDACLADLAGRGIEAGEIEVLPGKVRRTEVVDPDGNRIQLGHPPG